MFANPGFQSDRRFFEGELFVTATTVLDLLKTVDGGGSGLDADLLDGNHASAFSLVGHTHPSTEISDSTAAGRSMLTAANSAAQTALLDLFSTSSTTKGLVPGSNSAGTSYFLRADGTWAIPPGGTGGISDGDKGDITVSGSGSIWTIDALAVTDSKINDVAWSKITGEPTTLAGYGISDTKANFNNACSDGDFLFVGDITPYTDEMAQDAIGTLFIDSAHLDFTYDDALNTLTATVKTTAELQLAKLAIGNTVSTNAMLALRLNTNTGTGIYGVTVNSDFKVLSGTTTFANYLAFASIDAAATVTTHIGFYHGNAALDAGGTIQFHYGFYGINITNSVGYDRTASFYSAMTQASTLSVTSLTHIAGLATATVTAHGWKTGDLIQISGASPSTYNGMYLITYVDANTFTFPVPASLSSPATGTILARIFNKWAYWGAGSAPIMTNGALYVGRQSASYAYNNQNQLVELSGVVVQTGASALTMEVACGTTTTNVAYYVLGRSRGTHVTTERLQHVAVLDGDQLGQFRFTGDDGTQIIVIGGAMINCYAKQDWTPTAKAARLVFWTTPQNSTTATHVMTLTDTQNVLIGTQTDDTVNKLQVTGNTKLTGNLEVTGVTAIGTTTDANIKLKTLGNVPASHLTGLILNDITFNATTIGASTSAGLGHNVTYTGGSVDGSSSVINSIYNTFTFNSTSQINTARGIDNRFVLNNSGTVPILQSFHSRLEILSSGGIPTYIAHFNVGLPTYTGAGTVAQIYGFRCTDQGNGTKVAINTVIQINDQTKGTGDIYALRSQVTSATGKWNLYIDGTASNHLAGQVLIGSTSDNSLGRLQVSNRIWAAEQVNCNEANPLFPNGYGFSAAGTDSAVPNYTLKNNTSTVYGYVGLFSTAMYVGTYSNIPLTFISNNLTRIYLSNTGSLVLGFGALATNATDGFIYLPSCAGSPSGVPTSYTGTNAAIYDSTNFKLKVYSGGWKDVGSVELFNANTAVVSASGADTYLTGSSLTLSGRIKAGTILRWRFGFTKTAAGTAAPSFNVRFGTAGTTADTARLTYTGVAQTAATDTGFVELTVIIRSVGASGTVTGTFAMHHFNTTTGLANKAQVQVFVNVSGTFATNAGTLIAGVSCNPGASGVWSFELVHAEAINLLW